jgi:tRNA (mo5U34)-methyltransferase
MESAPSAVLEGKSRADLLDLARRFHWWHAIDLGGVVTGGTRSPLHSRAFDEVDFKGKKVLDVGCWDGLWSFEAEKRGAREVYSIDYVSLRAWSEQPTYQLAHKLLGSKAKYYPNLSVYDIQKIGVTDFDVVIYCGVYYHLLDPLRAFGALREVMVEGGVIIAEGPVIDGTAQSFAKFYNREWLSGDPTNWFVPTIPCLREWLDCTFFDVIAEISVKHGLSVFQPPSVSATAKTLEHAQERREVSTLARMRSFLAGGGRDAPVALPPSAEELGEDRYLAIARATSVAERLATRVTGPSVASLAAPTATASDGMSGFCAAAAEYHARKPWERIRDEVTIKLECALFGEQPLFVMLLGARSRHRGLAIYFDRGWLTMTRQGSLPDHMITWAPFLGVFFSDPATLPPGEAAALEANGWKRKDSHPFAVFNEANGEATRETGNTLRRPHESERRVLEACCRALPAFIDRHNPTQPAAEEVEVATSAGPLKLKLSWMTEGGREL